MENEFKNKLQDFIDSSDLNNDQKELWRLFMLLSSQDEDEAIFEAISEKEENLILLTRHMRDKILSMESSREIESVTDDEAQFSREIEDQDLV